MNTSHEINTLLRAAHEEGLDVMGIVLSNRVQRELEAEAAAAGRIVKVSAVAGEDRTPVMDRHVVAYLHPVTDALLPIHVADLPSRVIGITIPEP